MVAKDISALPIHSNYRSFQSQFQRICHHKKPIIVLRWGVGGYVCHYTDHLIPGGLQMENLMIPTIRLKPADILMNNL